MRYIVAGAFLVLSGCIGSVQETAPILPPGARYVAMGSSYAAGARIGPLVAASPERCGRAVNNYPHLLAARLGLQLVDVSCGGATTAHVLGPWDELPAQIEAVTSDTLLVTVTVGGNDVDFVRNLMIASCGRVPEMMPPPDRECPPTSWPTESDYQSLKQNLTNIAREVRRRAPDARLVFIDYLHVVPDTGTCSAIPMNEADLAGARETFRRLAEVTREAAIAEGAMLLPAGELSANHNACSRQPWAHGHPGQPAAWHPNAAGHRAIADVLVSYLRLVMIDQSAVQ